MKLESAKMRWHRDRLGWTLETLAEQAEVAEGTALRAEHGEDIRPSSGRRIARALGVDISELVPDRPGVVLPKGEAPSTPGPPEPVTVEMQSAELAAQARPATIVVDRQRLFNLLRERGMSESEVAAAIRDLEAAA